MARRLAAIMFTDLVGSTELAHKDEKAALGLLREQESLADSVLALHQGRRVKSTGDGMLAEFGNARDALECAVEFQRRAHDRPPGDGGPSLKVRVGIHLGDVEGHGTDILGDAVNIAARVEPLAEPGGIAISESVYVQVRNKVPYTLESVGPRSLKGVAEPVEIYRVVLPWTGRPSAAHPAAVPRLAVLPLANTSSDPENEYFADGLTEELIAVLARMKGLRVIAPSSVRGYKRVPKPIATVGSELGVTSVLEGSVRKSGNRLRISLQLIDVATQDHRWVETYDQTLDDLFSVQTAIAEKTARAVVPELLGADLEAIRERPRATPEAYEAYLQAVYAYRRADEEGFTKENLERCLRAFERSLELDPKFAPPYAALANLLIHAAGEVVPASEAFARARPYVEKALELDPDSSETHTAKGNYALQADKDWNEAESEFSRAIALNPNNSAALFWYGYLLGILQRFDESERTLRSVIDLDPLWERPRQALVGWLRRAGKFEDALSVARSLLPFDPWYHVFVGEILLDMGDVEGARGEAALTRMPEGVTYRAIYLAGLRARLGDPEDVKRLLAEGGPDSETRYIRPSRIAALHALLNERETAFLFLQRDLHDGDRSFTWDYQDPWYDSIRQDPRFVALLRKYRLPTEPPTRLVRSDAAKRAPPNGPA